MEENQVNIPDGWKLNELGNLIREQRKSSLKVSDAANFGEFPFFTSGEAVLQHTSKQLDGKNIFLATGGVANIKYYEGDAAYSTDTYAITTRDEIDTEFLYFDLLNILYYINANYFQGSGLKHLQKKDLKKHQILFPLNPTEQTQIATILSKLDEAIAQTEQLIAKYTRIKTGLMQDLLTKGIDEHGNIRSEETHEFKDSPLGRIPKEWEVKSLISMTKEDICYGIVQVGKNLFGGIKTIAIKDLNTNYEDVHLTDPIIEKRYLRSRVQGGELLLSIKATTDKVDIVPINFQGNISRDIAKLSFKDDCMPLFYKYYFLADAGRKALDLITIGTIRKEISIAPLKKVEVLKTSRDEQQRVLNAINSSDENIRIKSFQLTKLQSLKTGLMQDLLSGKVRVNHLIKETASV